MYRNGQRCQLKTSTDGTWECVMLVCQKPSGIRCALGTQIWKNKVLLLFYAVFFYFALNTVSAFYVCSHLFLYRHRHAHTVWPRLARSHITTELNNSKHLSVQIILLSRLFKTTSVCWHEHACPRKTTWEFIKWKWDLATWPSQASYTQTIIVSCSQSSFETSISVFQNRPLNCLLRQRPGPRWHRHGDRLCTGYRSALVWPL